tara:strand:+ start:1415 stop:2134 length:720 start_codon:yes stop_codon:yes gene_type:complete
MLNKNLGKFLFAIIFFIFSSLYSRKPLLSETEMAFIPSGAFMMGAELEPDQSPFHEVFLDSFYIDTYEVTQEDFETIMKYNPSKHKGPSLPVEFVDWFEASEYCKKINKRLPSEAEWEKSVRSSYDSKYYWGNTMDGRFSWFKANSQGKTHPVGEKKPNAYGIYDMSGNVWEWVSDWYDKNYYKNSPYSNPQGPESGKFKVQRGGSWSNMAEYHTSSYRMVYGPTGKDEFNGFRCAKSK